MVAFRKITSAFAVIYGLQMSIHQLPQVAAVEYEVAFDATWSAATHPGAFPGGAHFSPLIGATHNSQVSFWEIGGIATPGIEQMAETGATSTLHSEFLAAGADTDTMILGSGIGSPGSTSVTFDVEESHSLVTLVTMVAPSPDWFVGVSGLDLRSGGSWVPQVTVDLHSYDAGTDGGPDFTSPNQDTNPQDPIALLGAPFSGATIDPLGTYTFTLVPEPATWALMLLGVTSLLHHRRLLHGRRLSATIPTQPPGGSRPTTPPSPP